MKELTLGYPQKMGVTAENKKIFGSFTLVEALGEACNLHCIIHCSAPCIIKCWRFFHILLLLEFDWRQA